EAGISRLPKSEGLVCLGEVLGRMVEIVVALRDGGAQQNAQAVKAREERHGVRNLKLLFDFVKHCQAGRGRLETGRRLVGIFLRPEWHTGTIIWGWSAAPLTPITWRGYEYN